MEPGGRRRSRTPPRTPSDSPLVSASPPTPGRRKRSDLDSSDFSPGALFCSALECQKVYLAGRSHGSKKQHSALMQPPTEEQWEQHCIKQGNAKEREDVSDSALQRNSERKRGDKPGSASVIVDQEDVASGVKPSAGQRKARKPYTFTFGKYYRKTLDHVLRLQPSYIRWLVNVSDIPTQRKHFRMKKALIEAGFLKEISGSDDYEAGPNLPKQRSNWRRNKLGPPQQPHHCSVCGTVHHNSGTCVVGSAELRGKVLYAREQEVKERRRSLYSLIIS